MASIEDRLTQARRALDSAKAAKAKAEAERDLAEKQLQEITAQLAEEGLTPDQLPAAIEALEKEIEETLTKAEGLIPQEYKEPVARGPLAGVNGARPTAGVGGGFRLGGR